MLFQSFLLIASGKIMVEKCWSILSVSFAGIKESNLDLLNLSVLEMDFTAASTCRPFTVDFRLGYLHQRFTNE